MIIFRQAQTIRGTRRDFVWESALSQEIDATHLTFFPALMDPHVHFRTPGAAHKETWLSASRASIAGGVTTVLDMPNTSPSCTTKERLEEKAKIIDAQLQEAKIPLRYGLYLGADERCLEEISRAASQSVGLKIYMGSSTGDLLMSQEAHVREAFLRAARSDLLVAVHAEDEEMIASRKKRWGDSLDPARHSLIRSPEVAAKAVEKAIALVKESGARLYIAHVSTRLELDLIRQAKREGIPVFAEATPHHLFLNDTAYAVLGSKALVNPPLRSIQDQEALWEGVNDGTIDVIGTDHAPHTLEEKEQRFGLAPSGFPGIEFYFSLLLQAFHEHRISLEKIVSLTREKVREIFRLPDNDDGVFVDLNAVRTIDTSMIYSKARWSPYAGRTLQGWPIYTVCKGNVYESLGSLLYTSV